jgi:hypothetical protein
MDQINKIKAYLSEIPIQEQLKSPYVIGAISFILVAYMSFMVPHLPTSVAHLFSNPILKVGIFFVILGAHRFSPILAIGLAVAFIISVQTISRFKVIQLAQMIKGIDLYQHPNAAERAQVLQELEAEKQQSEQPEQPQENDEPETDPDHEDGLHPINRPTAETLYKDNRVLDPNDPEHPGWSIMKDPEVDVAIFELNPPFAYQDLPMDTVSPNIVNKPKVMPEGGPTRYSASHGYYLS